MTHDTSSGLARPVLVGVVAGLVVLLLEGALGWLAVTAEGARVRQGWDVLPTVVLTRDAGPEVLTAGMLGIGEGLDRYTTRDAVKPAELPSVINQRLTIPTRAGDPLQRSDLAGQPELVLFATHPLAPGAVITAGDFEARPFRADWLTPSWVRARQADELVGRLVRAPLRAGDPALWTQLSAAKP